MDPRVRADNNGTLYLADVPEPSVVQQQKRHGLLYYAMLGVITVFVLGWLAIMALFMFFLILAFL